MTNLSEMNTKIQDYMLLEIANMFLVASQFIKMQTNNFCINLSRIIKYHTENELEQHYKINIFYYGILRSVTIRFFSAI